jgi:hypothetical protein
VDELDAVADAVKRGVGPGHLQRIAGAVERVDLEVRSPDGHRDGYAAATGTQIDDRGLRRKIERQHDVDDAFGLGPRDQYARVHVELESVELLHAGDVLGRFPRRAPGDPRLVAFGDHVGQTFGASDEQASAVGVEQMRQQELGLEPGVRHAGVVEQRGGHGEAFSDRRQLLTSCLSFSAWSCEASESMISVIAPFMIAGRLCRVRPTRWSVTRFCGKL